MKQYVFHGHRVTLQDGRVICETCSVPLNIHEMIKFMASIDARKVTLDGVDIERVL